VALERHFKNISVQDPTKSLEKVIETIPGIFQGLEFVWLINQNYSKEDRMNNLLFTIEREINDKVKLHLKVDDLFEHNKMTPTVQMTKTMEELRKGEKVLEELEEW